jgi:hypothetical protein
MTNRDLMLAELAKSPLCDDCLGEILGKRRQTFFKLGNYLENEGMVKRPKAVCPRCHKGKIVNYLTAGRPSPVITPPMPPKPAVTDKPWFWEGNVQARLVDYLCAQGYRITQVADTAAKTPGVDIIAFAPEGRQLFVTVKGYPEGTNHHTQARHYFAETIFDIVLFRQVHPEADLAIALPDGFTTFVDLIPRVEWFMQMAPFRFFLVREDGSVRMMAGQTVISSKDDVR